MSGSPQEVTSSPRTRPGVDPALRNAERYHRMERSPLRIPVSQTLMDGHDDPAPPPEVEAAFWDVFGERRRGQVRLYFHPIYKRWMMLERYTQRTAKEQLWICIWICSTVDQSTPDDYVPADWQQNPQLYKMCAHMAGQVADYRVPNKRDFELIMEYGSTRQFNENATQIEAKQHREEERERKAAKDRVADFERDFVDYNDRIFLREENDGINVVMNTSDIRGGSRWSRLRELATWNMTLHASGFWIRKKRTPEERVAFLEVWGEELERAGQQETRALMSYLERQREDGVDLSRGIDEKVLAEARALDEKNASMVAETETPQDRADDRARRLSRTQQKVAKEI